MNFFLVGSSTNLLFSSFLYLGVSVKSLLYSSNFFLPKLFSLL
uniref:Uncharacterized protein n=1 Tax=Myoviridae sp. ct6F13 TaxID=2827602 RepID=A0A8S5LJI9_9CAUD|nr:MAG TPA: hypothetical protein [Myoviridae sp. ct6F13]